MTAVINQHPDTISFQHLCLKGAYTQDIDKSMLPCGPPGKLPRWNRKTATLIYTWESTVGSTVRSRLIRETMIFRATHANW